MIPPVPQTFRLSPRAPAMADAPACAASRASERSRFTGGARDAGGAWFRFPLGRPQPGIARSVRAPAAEGKGYAVAAGRAARASAFGALGWTTAVGSIAPDTARSMALAERPGAAWDDAAAPPVEAPTLVFRHPRPGARA